MTIKNICLTALVPFALAGALPATAQDTASATAAAQTQETASDVPRRLKKITVFGSRRAPAAQTGRLIMDVGFRPNSAHRRLFTSRTAGRSASFQAINTERYRLTFARVDFNDEGAPVIAPASAEKRFFRVSGQAASDNTFAVDLPEGYYALSEVRYDVRNRLSQNVGAGNLDVGGGNSGINGPGLVAQLEPVNYCVAGKTFVFEVVNGQTNYLGAMVLQDPEANRARRESLIPIAGFTQNTQALTKESNWDERAKTEISDAPLRAISLQDPSACRTAGSHRVQGWESVSNATAAKTNG